MTVMDLLMLEHIKRTFIKNYAHVLIAMYFINFRQVINQANNEDGKSSSKPPEKGSFAMDEVKVAKSPLPTTIEEFEPEKPSTKPSSSGASNACDVEARFYQAMSAIVNTAAENECKW